MPWSYKHNPELRIYEVRYKGKVTAHDLQQSSSELIALQKANDVNRYLVDATDMQFSGSLVDVYDIPHAQYEEEGADRSGRVAVVLPRELRSKEAVIFYETVCRNRGWDAQAFSAFDEAVSWLTSSGSA